MVVTSRMLAAHTNGYPIDAKARFWSNYYRSLKEAATPTPSSSYSPSSLSSLLASKTTTSHPSSAGNCVALTLAGLPPVEYYWDCRYHQRTTSPPRLRDVTLPWWHLVPELRPDDLPKEYIPARSKHDLTLRPSFLSPVKKKYIWTTHPQRKNYYL
ncbi:uncharacterized protein [Macrobrachium rosenbergii]|uniref:uncharacterized protein isoform X2 n=1 Tax=Macrobrachium rosenbergii TaxID=79674 RepID=UPI0034D5E2F8